MKTIKIDLSDLADKIVEKFDFHIDEHHLRYIEEHEAQYIDFVEDYVRIRTPPKMIIMEPALQTVIDEVWPFVVKEIHRRVNLEVSHFEAEDLEILKTKIKEYEAEND